MTREDSTIQFEKEWNDSPTKKVIGKFINNNHQTQGEEDGYNQG
jgi:hypothetical protein